MSLYFKAYVLENLEEYNGINLKDLARKLVKLYLMDTAKRKT